jgi:hypothetical protein
MREELLSAALRDRRELLRWFGAAAVLALVATISGNFTVAIPSTISLVILHVLASMREEDIEALR